MIFSAFWKSYLLCFICCISGLSTVDASSLDDIDPTVQAYEVLQELPNHSGSYIIAQSGASQSLQSSQSEHIIVQTVPVSQVMFIYLLP